MNKISVGEFEILKKFLSLNNKGDFSVLEYLDTCNFDVSGEIHMDTGSFLVQYDIAEKYITPVNQGNYQSFYEYGRDHVVHPDDLDAYEKVLGPNNILQALRTSKTPNLNTVELRLKLKDGSYHLILNFLISGKENGLDDNTVRFFIFDINNIYNRQNGQKLDTNTSVSPEVRDPLTNLFSKNYFEKNAASIIEKNPFKNWIILSLDIEHFTLFDEWYGRDKSRYVLANIGHTLGKYADMYAGLAGYLGHDNFIILLPYDIDVISDLYNEIKNDVASFKLSKGFLPAFGVCFYKDAVDLDDAIDKADIAAYKAKTGMKNRIHIYDPNEKIKSEEEYRILIETMDALNNKEITFFLQPQCRISTKKIVGAEALARWIKPDGTRIYPGSFIPILEKYGFIIDLDTYIWEQVCIWIRSELDKGHNMVPISLNVSQIDVFSIDVAEYLLQLITKYKIPNNLLKIEITESAYGETAETVSDLVKKLRDKGFTVLMDDFGSGYSSLNMLSNLKIDALKLDALFLNFGNAEDKAIKILESVVSMAKQIGIPIIVEGVENQKQCNFLEELGCRYAQGYHFYSVYKKEEFAEIISDINKIDPRGFVAKSNEQFRIREFLDRNIYSDAMLNNVIGAVALYLWTDDGVDIVRYNEQFYKSVGSKEFNERINHIERFLHRNDKKVMFNLFQEAMNNTLSGSKGKLRFYREDGFLTIFEIRFYYIGEREGFPLFYGSANNISKLVNQEEYIKIITEYTNSTYIFIRKSGQLMTYDVAVYSLENDLGFTSKEIEEKLNNGLMRQNIRNYDQIVKELKEDGYEKDFYINFVSKKGNIVSLEIKIRPVKGDTNIIMSIQVSID